VISGYDTLVRARQIGEHMYYTYGWDGSLSDKSRKQEALVLYNTLIDLRDQLSKQFPGAIIKFILHAHSHGGNVILYLGLQEDEQRKNLVIDTAVLYGTPIQVETARFCLHPLFKKIINIFSEGDTIQLADKFSTKGPNKRTFASALGLDLISREKRVIELCVSAAGNKSAFGHAPFYCMGVHGRGVTTAVEQVFNMITPLPIVLFAPLFLDMLNGVDACEGTLDFNCPCPGECKLVLASDKRTVTSCDLVSLIVPMQEVLEKSWKPYAIYGHVRLGLIAVEDLFKKIPQFVRDRYSGAYNSQLLFTLIFFAMLNCK
jgi:hypothetical protein